MEPTSKVKVIEVVDGHYKEIEDTLANEVAFNFRIGGNFITIYGSPTDVVDLIAGMLIYHGYSLNELNRVSVLKGDDSYLITLRGRPAGREDSIRAPILSSEVVLEALNSLMTSSKVHKVTGATHVMGIFDESGRIKEIMEDVSRHTLLYKILGRMRLKGYDPEEHFLALSCRITRGIVDILRRGSVGFAASKAAVTVQAARLGRLHNITLIGFARGNRMLIYSGEERVRVKQAKARPESRGSK